MTRHYETMFILKATLTEDEQKARIAQFEELLTKQGATIDAKDEMGTRDLAYKIEKQARGVYTVIYFTAEPSAIAELERVYRITEDVIRFIVISYEKKVEVAAWENMVKKANGLPVVEKKLSYAQRDRRPRRNFDDKRPPRKEYTPRDAKPAETTESAKAE